MKRPLYSVALLLAGVALGWWLHGRVTPVALAPLSNPPANSILLEPDRTPEAALRQPTVPGNPRSGPVEGDPVPSAQRFRELLERQEFDQAIALYERATDPGDANQLALRPVLEGYLNACLRHCRAGVFVALVDAWLASYYEDIPVLLLLAEYQRLQGYPEEAAKVLYMAMTYAYQPDQRERVTLATRQLVASTDQYLSQEQRWIELAGFYESLEATALGEPEFRLRQAAIYRILGEQERARSVLLALRSSDSGIDPQWTRSLELQLAEISPEPEAPRADAIPVTSLGDHYLVEVTLNDRERVLLVIDTGASITSLSRASFSGLSSGNFTRGDARLFNTANGLARGEVYRAASLALGDNHMEGVELAVLDYEAPPGVDGLLGMNVLRNYHFEIDQEKNLLYLRRR